MPKMSKKKLWKKIAQSWQLYLLLLVPIVWLVTFEYVPMAGLQIAFKDFSNKGGIWGSPWVGLEKFKKFFSDRQFSRLMINTLRISIYSMAVGFIVPIIMALSLNILKDGVFKKTVQTLTYIPHFLSVVVLVGMVMQLFNPVAGLYGTICQAITGTRPADLMGIPEAFPHLYVCRVSGRMQDGDPLFTLPLLPTVISSFTKQPRLTAHQDCSAYGILIFPPFFLLLSSC